MIAILPLLWRFRGLIGVALAVLALGAAVAWHQHRVSALKERFFAAGQTAERIVWEEARRKAELQRAAERKAAEFRLAALDAQFAAQELRNDIENKEHSDDLERALAAIPPDNAPCRVLPDGVLAPLRRLGP